MLARVVIFLACGRASSRVGPRVHSRSFSDLTSYAHILHGIQLVAARHESFQQRCAEGTAHRRAAAAAVAAAARGRCSQWTLCCSFQAGMQAATRLVSQIPSPQDAAAQLARGSHLPGFPASSADRRQASRVMVLAPAAHASFCKRAFAVSAWSACLCSIAAVGQRGQDSSLGSQTLSAAARSYEGAVSCPPPKIDQNRHHPARAIGCGPHVRPGNSQPRIWSN